MRTTRRIFLLGTAGAALSSRRLPAATSAQPKVLIVGGGFGGASVARWLRRTDPKVRVTLVERETQFVTCPLSNAVLGGLRDLESITFGYDGLRRAGIDVVRDDVTSVDPTARRAKLSNGSTLDYDRLVLAPGIELVWNAIRGYDQRASLLMPHAWNAGTQTQILRRQLEAMDDGGLIVLAVPPEPFRYAPGPYERACLIAHYLKSRKPRSKILILDAQDKFSMQPLFEEAWKTLYPGLIERIPGSESGRVVEVDTRRRVVSTDFDEYGPAVANIIPPQRAGQIAISLGLDAGKGFCAVDPRTFESKVLPGIHLVGDAIRAGAMPKSGFSANSQAKVCARALAALLRNKPVEDPVLVNTCYSLAAPGYGFSIAGVYQASAQGIEIIKGSGGTSPVGASRDVRALEAEYGESWYRNITAEIFD